MTPERLPRGRHRLSREVVASAQRERMLRAMTEAVSERGYADVPVAEVLSRAGVSRETFYEHFENRRECFLAAYETAAAALIRAIQRAVAADGAPGDGHDRIDRLLASYLAALADEPSLARTFLVEVYAAGPAAIERRHAVQAQFAAAVATITGAEDDRQRFACEALVAATGALVTQRVAASPDADLGELRAPLLDLARSVMTAVGLGDEAERDPPR